MVGNETEFEDSEIAKSFGKTGESTEYKSRFELWDSLLIGEKPAKNAVLNYEKDEALIETDEGKYLVKLNLGSKKNVEPIGVQRKGEKHFEYF